MNEGNSSSFRFGQLFQSQFGLIWLLFGMVVLFSITSSAFRSPDNLLEILRASGIYAILVLGLTWVVAVGELDVSFASAAALVSMITAYLINLGIPIGFIVILALAAGTMIGVINGIMVSYLKIPSLIATIATGFTATAIAKVMGEGKPIFITTGTRMVHEFVYGKIFGIPVLFLTALVIYLACRFLQDRTVMGQHLYALGENRQATQEAGINASKIVFYYFILSSVMSSIAGILVTAQFGSGQHEIGGGNAVMIEGFTAVGHDHQDRQAECSGNADRRHYPDCAGKLDHPAGAAHVYCLADQRQPAARWRHPGHAVGLPEKVARQISGGIVD